MTAEAYAVCQRLARSHYENFPVASVLVPARMRPHIAAVYAFARTADDFADEGDLPPAERLARLDDWEARLDRSSADDPVFVAVRDTIAVCGLDPQLFRDLVSAFRQDVTTTRYATWADLLDYMDGSAAVIGEMMLPILEPADAAAFGHARDLGNAFQLTNFLRDINEDLDRGRMYVPQEDLRRFGVDLAPRTCTQQFIELMKFEIERCRALYASADLGIAMLPARSARCIRAARTLYSRILERIEAQNYDVFVRRASVPTWQKALVVGRLVVPFGG